MDCGVIVLGLLFEPDIGEFSSSNFTVKSLDNKEITFHAKNGVIVMEKNTEETPTFQQEFHYPSYGIPKDIRDTCENLRTVAELFGETKFSKFEMDWGYNDNTNPYLIRFTRLELAQGKQLKPQFNEAMVFASLQKYNENDEEEEIDEDKCYMDTKDCTKATQDFDKKKFIECSLDNYISSIQSTQQKKEVKANILNILHHVCPEMLEGTIRLCPACYKKLIEQKEKKKYQKQQQLQQQLQQQQIEQQRQQMEQQRQQMQQQQQEQQIEQQQQMEQQQHQQKQLHQRSQQLQHKPILPIQQQHKTLSYSGPVPRKSNTQKVTGRGSVSSSRSHTNNDIFLSQRDYKSGCGYLRPTQKISYYSYKRASKIYLSTAGFPPLNRNRPKK